MTIISIGGVSLPAPSDFQVNIQDIDKADRNARGVLIKERIRSGVRKIELGWKLLTADEMALILNAVSPSFFSVTYPDPQTNGNRTGTFYSGDRPAPMYDYRNGVPRYKDVKFNLIEK